MTFFGGAASLSFGRFEMTPAILAFIAYSCFIAAMVMTGVTASRDAYPKLSRAHHIFSLLFACASFFLPAAFSSWLFAVFFLYSIHHLFFMFLFGIARRSFSLNLLVTMFVKDVAMSPRELAEAYADGRGLRSLADSRVNALLREGLIRINADRVGLTRKGALIVRIRNFLLVMFGLKDVQNG